ncbi:MAG: tetratricopeptide repeat protein [Syntrophorhabdales bacterium]|jgi:predicted Zn-dependent protease
MKYKISLLLFLLLFSAYVILSFLNADNSVRLEVGFGRALRETTVTNYIAASFLLGVVISLLVSFFTDARRGLARWRSERKEKKKNEAVELSEKARLFEMKGEPEKAVDYANRAIRSAPDAQEPYLILADMYAARGEPARAVEVLDLGERTFGKREAILFEKVKIHRGVKDTDGMERDLLDILRISESNLLALAALRDLYIARKAWEQALEIEVKVRKQVKTDGENQRLVGLQYENVKERFKKQDERQYEQILKDLREMTNDNKGFIPAYILSAEVYKKMGRLNDAGRVYGRGFAKTGHVIFLRQMEDLYIGRGEPGVILKIYRRLLEVTPRNQLLMFLYARLCLKLEMIDEAIDLLKTLLAEEKEFRGLHRAMAEAYIHRGKFEDAAREFTKAFASDQVYMPLYCGKCQGVKEEWADFCETCSNWNTIDVRQEGLFQQDAETLRVLYEQESWEAS